ncbi:MAG: patatin-like phospholipase family protein [Alsobacter sp.]
MADPSPRDKHLFGAGPKRILALDGGGVRGALSLAFLERLEETISEIEGRPTRLCDWFDLIGGTSTGAIIATALALGYSAAEIRAFYFQLAPKVFRRSYFRILGLQSKFDANRLAAELRSVFAERTLDSDDLQTGLCLTLKRMDTGSSWILMNNPRSAFWETPADGSFAGNRHLPLVNLVRASAAAPHFFDPELISIVEGQPPGLFVDGGLTPHNNPSLILALVAVLPAYGLEWALGTGQLTIVSVGTGSFRPTLDPRSVSRIRPIGVALKALTAQISEAQQLVLTLMSWLGSSPTPWVINSEIGDLGPVSPPFGPQFRFLRYDVRLEKAWLSRELDVLLDERDIVRLRHMDDPANVRPCYDLGAKAAARQIKKPDLVGP